MYTRRRRRAHPLPPPRSSAPGPPFAPSALPQTAGPGPGSYNHEGFYGSERLSRSRSAPRFSLPKQQRHMELPPRDTNPGLPNSKRFPGRPATASGTRSVT